MVASTERPAARIDFTPNREAEAAIDDEFLEQLVDRRRLRFPDPLESEFRAHYARRWLSTNRIAFGSASSCSSPSRRWISARLRSRAARSS